MNYADNILDAVDILIDKKISNLPFDKTIRATVVSIENADLLKYKVQYQNSTLFAYAVDSNQKYNVDDEVYVQILSNDFNKSPLIVGRVIKTAHEINTDLLKRLNLVLTPYLATKMVVTDIETEEITVKDSNNQNKTITVIKNITQEPITYITNVVGELVIDE